MYLVEVAKSKKDPFRKLSLKTTVPSADFLQFDLKRVILQTVSFLIGRKMAGIENNLSTIRLIENMKHEVASGQSKVIEVSKKLYGTIDSYTSSIDNGLNYLAVEVCGLEARLRIITKERDDLLDTVNNLRFEIMGLSSKLLPTMQPLQLLALPELNPNHNQDIQEVDSPDDRNCKTQGVKRPRISREDGDQEEHADYGVDRDQIDQEQIQTSLNNHNNLKDLNDDDCKKIGFVPVKGSSNERKKVEGQRARHVQNVSCEHCDYRTSRKANLKGHIKYAHEGSVNMLACDHCDYMTERKDVLRKHLTKIHGEVNLKNFSCEQCDYTASRNANLRGHIKNVHEGNINMIACDHCDYMTDRKYHLKNHITSMHGGVQLKHETLDEKSVEREKRK